MIDNLNEEKFFWTLSHSSFCFCLLLGVYDVVYSRDGLDIWHIFGQERWWHGNLKGRDHFEDLGLEGILILKFILKK